MTRRAALAAALAALLLQPDLTASAEPRRAEGGVLVIATGGTIANSPRGRLTARQLVDELPADLRARVRESESFSNVASPALDVAEWVRLARRVTDAFASGPTLEGVIVTAGTDTLEELAWFLHLTITDDRPVVVVGAMRRPGTPGADGPRNLGDAITAATSDRLRGLGTLVVMNGRVSLARDARKRHSTRLDAFDLPAGRVLATIDRDRVTVRRQPPPDPLRAALPLPPGVDLPRVDVVLTYQGAPGDLLECAVGHGAQGLVVAAAGAGSLTPAQARAARRLARTGTPIVIATRTGAGAVESFDPADAGIIAASNLSPVKARLTLMLALARRLGVEAIRRLFEPR